MSSTSTTSTTVSRSQGTPTVHPSRDSGRMAARRRAFYRIALDEQYADEAKRFRHSSGAVRCSSAWGAMLAPDDTGGEAGDAGAEGRMLFSWGGVRCYADGASSLRVRLTPVGDSVWSVAALDQTGAPVLSVESLAHRPIEAAQLTGAHPQKRSSLFRVEWSRFRLCPRATFATTGGSGDLDTAGVDAERYEDLVGLGKAMDNARLCPRRVCGGGPWGRR